MGLLSDFFIATPEHVSGLDVESSPLDRFPGFNCKGVEIVKILTLLSLVDGSDVMKNIGNIDSYFAKQGEESWIVEVPHAITERLSSVNDSELQTLARDWTHTDEWQLEEASVDDVLLILTEMAKLSTVAIQSEQSLYLWISL